MNTESITFDVAVIGSGPGGYVAAIKGSQLGLKVALIEKYAKFGGTCLHWGCIPTKSLLYSAELYDKTLKGREFGILCKDIKLDFRLAVARKDKIVKKLAMGTAFLMKKNRITTFQGRGTITAPGTVQVEGATPAEVKARNIVIATGSEAMLLPGLELDGHAILTNKEILDIGSVPKSLLVVGAGAVGIEFASLFGRFGSDVTIVEMLPRILPLEDAEISGELHKLLSKRRIKVLTGSRLENMAVQDGKVVATVTVSGGEAQTIAAERALIAVGRRPVTEGIGLETLGVATINGRIPVGAHMETNVPGVFAIGDVVPTQQLAHLASHQGMLLMRHLAGENTVAINYDQVPNCTFCHPEVASVGLTEHDARDRGYDVVTSRFPFAAIGKASILSENDGFVKLVCDRKYNQILGVHMIGPHVTELIAEGTAALGLEATAEDLSHLIHAHPTVSEAVMEAAEAIYGAAIHF
ncbi:MAG: dihydrolipoyl dehydrogenase [Acidobacteriia bacterium]|nr:dihydrolipoyl dehydrogenase [Terriglobia bacterium]